MKTLFTISALFILQYGAISQTYKGDKKQIDEILSNIKNFSSYVVTANYKKLSEAYTSDAKIFPSNMKIQAGTEPIINYWKLPDGLAIIHHKIMPEEITIVENTAYDYGYYEGTTKKANGEASNWKGKYVIVWKKIDNNWKIYLDIWNGIGE